MGKGFLATVALASAVCMPCSSQPKSDGLISIPNAAATGETYHGLTDSARSYYLSGLLDGFFGSPLLAGNENLATALHECLLQFHTVQIVAIVDKYIADNPALWHHSMHMLALDALEPSCPEFVALQKKVFKTR